MNKFTEYTIAIVKKNGIIFESTEDMRLDESSFQKVVALYEKEGFVLSEEVKEFLRYYANKTIVFKGVEGSDTIHLNTKKVLKKSNVLSWAETYRMKSVIPLGIFSKGMMNFFVDEKNNAYASFDSFLLSIGNSPFEGMNNLLANENLKEIQLEVERGSWDKVDTEEGLYILLNKLVGAKPKFVISYNKRKELELKRNSKLDGKLLCMRLNGIANLYLNDEGYIDRCLIDAKSQDYKVVKNFPKYRLIDDKNYYDFKIHKYYVDDLLEFYFKDKQLLCNKSRDNFMILLEFKKEYVGKRISKNLVIFFDENKKFLGFKVTLS